jgi:deoxyadenosine/deoxycytidine kinase
MARALDCAPQPDLLVRLDASTQALTSRLEDRFRQQGALERLLEPDLMTLLNSIGVIDVLNTLLRRRGQLVVPASSLDEPSLRKTVKSVAKQIAAISSAHKRAMAS